MFDQTGSALLYPGTTTTGVDKVLDGRKREDYLLTIYRVLLKLTITNLKKQFATKHLN
jgi:hypothetical protein